MLRGFWPITSRNTKWCEAFCSGVGNFRKHRVLQVAGHFRISIHVNCCEWPGWFLIALCKVFQCGFVWFAYSSCVVFSYIFFFHAMGFLSLNNLGLQENRSAGFPARGWVGNPVAVLCGPICRPALFGIWLHHYHNLNIENWDVEGCHVPTNHENFARVMFIISNIGKVGDIASHHTVLGVALRCLRLRRWSLLEHWSK